MVEVSEEAKEEAPRDFMSDYPEHAKLRALNGENQVVGGFIEWLGEQGLTIAKYSDSGIVLHWCGKTRDQILAEYFNINPNTLEAEKRAMLEAMTDRGAEASNRPGSE